MDGTAAFNAEILSRRRFRFGRNWRRYLTTLTDEQILSAQESLGRLLQVRSLAGKSFIDVGSGSGLFSLAARRLGAVVCSIDYDPESVWCTNELRSRFFPEDPGWTVRQMSILDDRILPQLGFFDVVYSWGVLHHTGQMWTAVANTARLAGAGALLLLALYNDQGFASRYWHRVKRDYNRFPPLRPFLLAAHLPYLLVPRLLARLLTGRLFLERGMSYWYDAIDWLGGYPFEVSKPEDVLVFLRREGFELLSLKTCGGRMGCNEYLLRRTTYPPPTDLLSKLAPLAV